eukprot:31251-Pelagococcus_subviridis.AAC.7
MTGRHSATVILFFVRDDNLPRRDHPREHVPGAAARVVRELELDRPSVQPPFAVHRQERLARGVAAGLAAHELHDLVLHDGVHLGLKLRPQLRARDVHGVVDQVLDDLIHVAAVEAHLRELRRFHLDERRVRDLREAPRDLGLAAPRGTDHEDVFGDDLVAKRRVDAVATPAVPERDRARALRVRLADDELIKEFHGLRRGEAVRAAERGAELLRERHRFVFPPFGRRRAAGSASGRRGGRRRRRRRR